MLRHSRDRSFNFDQILQWGWLLLYHKRCMLPVSRKSTSTGYESRCNGNRSNMTQLIRYTYIS
jgi:hypothetical protein